MFPRRPLLHKAEQLCISRGYELEHEGYVGTVYTERLCPVLCASCAACEKFNRKRNQCALSLQPSDRLSAHSRPQMYAWQRCPSTDPRRAPLLRSPRLRSPHLRSPRLRSPRRRRRRAAAPPALSTRAARQTASMHVCIIHMCVHICRQPPRLTPLAPPWSAHAAMMAPPSPALPSAMLAEPPCEPQPARGAPRRLQPQS